MKNVHDNVLDLIGDTPLIRLNKVTEGIQANVYVKVEYFNPGQSVKDRIALFIIEEAERRGEIKPGGTIVEATSGNTGAGLALAAAIKGYKCVFVLPDKQSEEKRAALRAYGAKVVVTPTDVEPEDPRSYYSVAKRIAEETPNAFYANQYHNPDNPEAHYRSTGPELYEQLEGNLDVFVCGLGTGGTATGIGRYLKERKPEIKVVGVDPVGSIYYDYFKTGNFTVPFTYVLEGIGEDFLPSTMDFQYVDDVVRTTDGECFHMTRRLAREEGLLVGASSGAAVVGALRWLEHNDRPGMNVVVLLPDHGSRYLSKVYSDRWMEEQGFLEPAPRLGTVADLLGAQSGQEPVLIDDIAPVSEAIALMKAHGISQVPVVRGKHLVGVLHERAVLEHELRGGRGARAGDLADASYCTVDRATEVTAVSGLLRKARIAIVLDGDAIVGVLTAIDIISHLARGGTHG